ncbi:hypothetical protein SLEP1_g26369 [Rubroshorea leprosula]|uniref:Transmembrane protein n=1 Tax=Rubroshorea leprosula TaxID=152421 RepID=A0AAV5JW49_9ROSI|nr:hypothetical protein SLEP1_g26369 [Rubroshorea leprosula]
MGKKAWLLKVERLWRWKTSGLKWKRVDFQVAIMDNLVFRVLYVVEAVVVVSTLCFFFLCCGCHV